MNTLLLFLCLCGVLGMALAFWRAPLWLWALAYAVLLLCVRYLAPVSPAATAALWLCYLLIFPLLLCIPLRRRIVSARLFTVYKRILPLMSATEQEALAAGTVWWDAELFSGRPDWKRLLAVPAPQLSADEQAFLEGPVEELCRMLDDWHITHERYDLPPEVWNFIKRERFFAMIIPKRYGGLEFSALAHSAVVMKISTRSSTAAVTVMVPNSLGPAILLLQYGTEEQRNHYLPRLACGAEIPCFALTAPEAGSDAGGMQDRGIVCTGEYGGRREVLGIRLTWNKRYITLGPVATLLGLAFKLHDPDHLLGENEDPGITLALIPTSHPGVEIGRRHFAVNIPFQNGPNHGEDVFIPMDWVIGGRAGVGQGWRMLMECLSDGRGISLPAVSTGAAKLAARTTGAYARVRQQFNVPIGEFEGVQEALARMGGLTYLAEAARLVTLGALDQGEKPPVITAIIKYHLTEFMRQVVNDAMDVHGGKGIMLGPGNYLARVYQALPVSITVEGANILTRNMIIFGQGAIRCHPHVLEEMHAAAAADAETGLRMFDRAIFRHFGFAISNVVRTGVLGLSGARLSHAPESGFVAAYYRQLGSMSAAFSMLADVAMLVLGGELKRRERLSARLGDVLSYLYLLSAVLKHHRDQGCPEPDRVLVQWSAAFCLYRMQEAIHEFLDNFPLRPVARMLRLVIFPFGRPYRKADDALEASVAGLLLTPGAARDRLTAGIHIPDAPDEAVAMLDDAMVKVIAADEIRTKLLRAMRRRELRSRTFSDAIAEAVAAGLIDTQAAATMAAAVSATTAVIQVDDFDPDELVPPGYRGTSPGTVSSHSTNPEVVKEQLT